MAKLHVSTTINGEPAEFLCEPGDTVLDALRGPLGLTGSKEGCASGDCGACSITVDDRLICSCLMLAVEAEGHELRSIEGMAQGDKLHPLQQKFLEIAALVTNHIPSAHFLLVGNTARENDNKYLRKLKRRCEDPLLKPRVTFLGYRSDIPDILAALDCFVHPSRQGAFVSVLIEAMATGVPLVVSDVDGIPECVGRDGAAELIKNLRPADFAPRCG